MTDQVRISAQRVMQKPGLPSSGFNSGLIEVGPERPMTHIVNDVHKANIPIVSKSVRRLLL